jgi:hypothetical protein
MDEMIPFEKLLWGLCEKSQVQILQDNFPGFTPEECEIIAGNHDPEVLESARERYEEIIKRWENGGQDPYTCEVSAESIEYQTPDDLSDEDKEKLLSCMNDKEEDEQSPASGDISLEQVLDAQD